MPEPHALGLPHADRVDADRRVDSPEYPTTTQKRVETTGESAGCQAGGALKLKRETRPPGERDPLDGESLDSGEAHSPTARLEHISSCWRIQIRNGFPLVGAERSAKLAHQRRQLVGTRGCGHENGCCPPEPAHSSRLRLLSSVPWSSNHLTCSVGSPCRTRGPSVARSACRFSPPTSGSLWSAGSRRA